MGNNENWVNSLINQYIKAIYKLFNSFNNLK